MVPAPITINSGVCGDGCVLTVTWPVITSVVLITISFLIVIVGRVSYILRQIQRARRTNQNDERSLQREDILMNSSDVIEIYFPFNGSIISIKQGEIRCTVCITSVEIYAIPSVEINETIEQNVTLFTERKLICYCDGCYSHHTQIGHSGFLTSDGTRRTQFISPDDPKRGSTDAEVLAACLAIQYALEKHYNTLIIYTDNSKVEQLLKRPKKKDNIDYPNICQILNQYQKQQGNNTIQVVRVRGHTTKYEQGKCQTKHQFAKIDCIVRRKTRRYIKRWWKSFEQTCSYYLSNT